MKAPRESEAINDYVRGLIRDGYSIQADVPLKEIDRRFGSIMADVVARRGDEIVIVEVKSKESAPSSHLEQVASIVASMGEKVRLDVIWTGSGNLVPTIDGVFNLAARASSLKDQDAGAGLLLAWSALEGAMRIFATREDLEPSMAGRQLLADLYGNRLITRSLYDYLDSVGRTRNLLAHGVNVEREVIGPQVDKDMVESVADLAQMMLLDSYPSVDRVLERLRTVLTRSEAAEIASAEESSVRLLLAAERAIGSPYDVGSIREVARELAEE